MKTLTVIFIITAAIVGGVMMYKASQNTASSVIYEDVQEDRARATTTSEKEMLVLIYDGVSASHDIRVLNLANRSFTGSLKAEIRHLTELRELDVSNNQLTGIPAEIGQLSKLEKLNLSYNPITGLPHEIGNLHNLLLLDLRGTNYSRQDLEVIRTALPTTTTILTN